MTTSTQAFTWIITGASRGFGRAITEHALGRGDAVVAAVRRPETVADLVERHPDRFAAVAFDARDTALARPLIHAALERFGRVDALVNNAGRGLVGTAEEVSEAELREAMDLHFFAPAALVRAVLPVMREQGSGTIVQVSSQGGRLSFPGVGGYSAGKFALEGWSEALAGEVAPFGVRVMIVEPSRFRTGFNAPEVLAVTEASTAYRDALAAVRADLTGADGIQEGDPQRAAATIVDLVHSDDAPPLRLPLGAEAVERISGSYRANLDAVLRWADTARATDFPDAPPSSRPVASWAESA